MMAGEFVTSERIIPVGVPVRQAIYRGSLLKNSDLELAVYHPRNTEWLAQTMEATISPTLSRFMPSVCLFKMTFWLRAESDPAYSLAGFREMASDLQDCKMGSEFLESAASRPDGIPLGVRHSRTYSLAGLT
jgi:hypothetical protein